MPLHRLQCIMVLLTCLVLGEVQGNGTTLHLEQIFTGRCFDFQQRNEQSSRQQNCSHMWKLFVDSFAYKPPCNVTENDYEELVNQTVQSLPTNQTMFWSGTKKIARDFTRANGYYKVFEDTLLGYALDELMWCGRSDNETGGVNYEECPSGDCPGLYIFWDVASTKFAQLASGVVSVVLNGSSANRPAYRNNSIFARIEIPNLSLERVTVVQAIVLHDAGKILEKCNNGSLLQLKADVEKHGFMFRCFDDPKGFQFLHCASDIATTNCKVCSDAENIDSKSAGIRGVQFSPSAIMIAIFVNFFRHG